MQSKDLTRLAEEYGTPLYVYDLDEMAGRARAVKSALGGTADLLYAAKANPNGAILKSALSWVDGLDISSGGELRMALAAGWEPGRLSLAGPGKTPAELDLAVGKGCGSISVESLDDLEAILAAGGRTGKKPRVSLRVNPLALAGPFALKMGGKPTQFGVDEEEASGAMERIAAAARAGRAEYAGLHVYAGTQCLDASAIIAGVENSLRLAAELEKSSGLAAPRINLGGGFGLAYYEGQTDLDLAAAGAGIAKALNGFRGGHPDARFVLELGRYIAGTAGWYLTRVLALKASRGKKYAILDGGMHQHLSASGNLGQTLKRNYRMRNLSNPDGEVSAVNLAGCLCTPIDLLGIGALVPEVRKGDLICLENSGAYGYTASPLFFLGHDAPREVVVAGGKSRVAREAMSPAEERNV
jgi:diaminopimelate decarboxylase